MAADPPTTEPTADEIGHEMEGTRAHMAAQVTALEGRLTGMATDAATAAGDAAEGVRDAVRAVGGSVRIAARDAAAAVRHAFDVRGHARRHPWLVLGVAVGVGFACGRLTRR